MSTNAAHPVQGRHRSDRPGRDGREPGPEHGDHGFTVAVFNRTASEVDEFVNGPAKGKNIIGTHSLEELVAALKRPRQVMMMVKAGTAGGRLHRAAASRSSRPGDIIIDGGNSPLPGHHPPHQVRREQGPALHRHRRLRRRRRRAARARRIMPGGSPAAWPHVKPIFQAIAAKVDDGAPCCDWVGANGAGHFVKMVHNGIEYGDMQLICEAYQLMKDGLGMTRRRDARGLRRVEQGRAGQLPDRDHPRHPRPTRTRTASRSST